MNIIDTEVYKSNSMKNIFVIVSFLLLTGSLSAQQEALYTQGQFNNYLILNPAYAGKNVCPDIGLKYRYQWAGFEGAPSGLSAIGETLIKDKIGLGMVLSTENIGILRNYAVDLNLNYHLSVSEQGRFALGFKGGVQFQKSKFSKLSNVDPSDPLYDPGLYENETLPFIGVGMLYYDQRFFLGLSSPLLVSFEQTSTREKIIEPHFYGNIGYRFSINDDVDVTPSMFIRFEPTAPVELDLAVNVWFLNSFGIGASYRTKDAVNLMLQYMHNKLLIGYSFDMTLTNVRSQTVGSHEIFLGYRFCGEGDPDASDPNPISF